MKQEWIASSLPLLAMTKRGQLAPPIAPVAVSAAEIGHPHQLRNHAHQLAAAIAAEHADEVAAAHAVTSRSKGRAAVKSAGDSAGHAAATAFHHLAHHRSHGLHHHA